MLTRKQAYARIAASFAELQRMDEEQGAPNSVTAITLNIRQDHDIGIRAIVRPNGLNYEGEPGHIDEYKIGPYGIEWVALTKTAS